MSDFPDAPRPKPTPATPGTIEFHVSAHNERGGSVPEIWGDQDKYADCKTLAQAKDWARNTFQDPRVAHCEIRESVKGPHGTGWTPGRHLETVMRPPNANELRDLAAQTRAAGLRPAPAAALPPHLRAARRAGR